jgi:hypothetical protein
MSESEDSTHVELGSLRDPSCSIPNVTVNYGYIRRLGLRSKTMDLQHSVPLGPSYGHKGETNGGLPPEARQIPFEFNRMTAKLALEAYRVFDLDKPIFSVDPISFHGSVLRMTKEVFCLINPNPRVSKLLDLICEKSIMCDGFNNDYSDVTKYARQCYWGVQWSEPAEFPKLGEEFDEFFTSWKTLKRFINLAVNPKTPEVLLPPELLFPWKDKQPEGIEILEEDHDPSLKIEHHIVEKIIEDMMHEPTSIPTKVDFLVEQTNTKKCCRFNNLSKVLEEFKKAKPRYTDFKYVEVTKWLDKDCPHQEELSIRTPIWKRPSEYRDAVCLNPCTLYRVWRGNAIVHSVFSNNSGWAEGTTQEDLCKFSRDSNFFIMTDYKKSGLTLPHWFVEMVNKLIKRRFPYLDMDFPNEGWKIFDRQTSKVFFPKDFGYSLGMVNHYYTLFNLVIFRYAKDTGIFSEKDKMLSFNDDSVISTQEKAYHRWLLTVKRFGGYLDVHKTFSARGSQFCEMHQFKDIYSNFKWVSFFHTLCTSMWKSYNFDHFRKLAGDMYDQMNCFQMDINPNGREQNKVIHDMLIPILKNVFESFWKREIVQLPFSLGGVALGSKFRTWTGLQKDLRLATQAWRDNQPQVWKYLIYTWKANKFKPKFRPWKPFPDGKTKDALKILGDFEGIDYELSIFKDKVRNNFLIDNELYNKKFWDNFSKEMENCRRSIEENYFEDFNNFVQTNEFYACALDPIVVKEEISFHEKQLPFAKLQTEKSKYSLPSLIINYINLMTGDTPVFPFKEINFKNLFQFEVPVVQETDHYRPIIDIFLLGKISKFHDPRRVFLDYGEAYKAIPLDLYLTSSKYEDTLKLMKSVIGEDRLLDIAAGASWWTKLPMPVLKEWESNLKLTLPTLHDELLSNYVESFYRGLPIEDYSEVYLSDELIEAHKKYNPDFWKKILKRRKKNDKRVKKNPSVAKRRVDSEKAGDHIFLQLNMDENQEFLESLFDQVIGDLIKREAPAPVVEEKPEWMSDTSALIGKLDHSWMVFDTGETPEPEILSSEETEEDLLARMLDQGLVGSPDRDEEEDD